MQRTRFAVVACAVAAIAGIVWLGAQHPSHAERPAAAASERVIEVDASPAPDLWAGLAAAQGYVEQQQKAVGDYIVAVEREEVGRYIAAVQAAEAAQAEQARQDALAAAAPQRRQETAIQAPAQRSSGGGHSDAWWHGVAICEQGGRNDPYFGYFSFMDGSMGGQPWDVQVAAGNAVLARSGAESPAWAPSCVAAGYAASPGG